MQRKIIQQSATSKGISLPSTWVEQWQLKKGDAVNVTIAEGVLEVRPQGFTPPEKKATIDAILYGKMTRRVFDTLSKRGYDEITVFFQQEKDLEPIKETLKAEATMFEIVKKEKDYVVLKSIVSINKDELKQIMNRLFFLLREKAHKLEEYLAKEEPTLLKDLLELEQANNKLAHLCLRAMHQQAFEESSYRKSILVWAIEKMGNDFKFFAHAQPKRIKPATKDLYAHVLKNINALIDLFFSYDEKKAVHLYETRKYVAATCTALLKRKDNVDDHFILHLALSLSEKCLQMLGLLFAFPEEGRSSSTTHDR
ncbi:MAG: hypothetical protein V1725_00880 [archaeon]